MKKKISYKENLREYLRFLGKYKFTAAFLIILIASIESVKIVDKILLKILIDKSADFSSGAISLASLTNTLYVLAIIFISVAVFVSFSSWIKLHIINRLEANINLDLKKKYFNHIIHLSHRFFASHKTGSLISKIIRASSGIERFTDTIIFSTAPAVIQLIVVSATAAYFDLFFVAITLSTVTAIISFNILIQRVQRKKQLITNKKEDIEKGFISDVFTNIDSVKYFGKEQIIKQKFLKRILSTLKAQIVNWDYYRWIDAGNSIIVSSGYFLLISYAVLSFIKGRITLGTLAFVFTSFGQLIMPVYWFLHGMRDYYRSMADMDAIFKYGKIHNEIKDLPGAEDAVIEKGEIEFKNVGFKYKKKRQLLKNFNLKIKPNEKIALVGHSGCGKTTLVKMIFRLFDPIEGQILIDRKDLRKFKQESLRNELSIVPQECILFDDTIYNNIKFSNPSADRKDVFNAIKFAQLDEFIKSLPKKENTVVGERGVKISGGEKQRVSIARALLADKKILVLDEATSSLDSKTEHQIQSDLKNLMKGRTSVIIAHRLSTIMSADRVIVMERGKIVQQGTHNQLIRKKGKYKELWELQKGGYIE